jgi:hypothetical protein
LSWKKTGILILQYNMKYNRLRTTSMFVSISKEQNLQHFVAKLSGLIVKFRRKQKTQGNQKQTVASYNQMPSCRFLTEYW